MSYRIKFYENERRILAKEHKLFVDTQEHVRQIVNKLIRHFKLKKVDIKFAKNAKGCIYRIWSYYPHDYSNTIIFPYNKKHKVSIAYICHEVAHHKEVCTKHKSGHTKKLLSIIKRMVKYCEKNNYWGMMN